MAIMQLIHSRHDVFASFFIKNIMIPDGSRPRTGKSALIRDMMKNMANKRSSAWGKDRSCGDENDRPKTSYGWERR
jgi:hypothetical protein